MYAWNKRFFIPATGGAARFSNNGHMYRYAPVRKIKDFFSKWSITSQLSGRLINWSCNIMKVLSIKSKSIFSKTNDVKQVCSETWFNSWDSLTLILIWLILLWSTKLSPWDSNRYIDGLIASHTLVTIAPDLLAHWKYNPITRRHSRDIP